MLAFSELNPNKADYCGVNFISSVPRHGIGISLYIHKNRQEMPETNTRNSGICPRAGKVMLNDIIPPVSNCRIRANSPLVKIMRAKNHVHPENKFLSNSSLKVQLHLTPGRLFGKCYGNIINTANCSHVCSEGTPYRQHKPKLLNQ